MKLRKRVEQLCYNKNMDSYRDQGVLDWTFLSWLERIELTRLEMSWSKEVYLTNKYNNPDLFNYLKSLGEFNWRNLSHKLQYKYCSTYVNIDHTKVLTSIINKVVNHQYDDIDRADARRAMMMALRLLQMDKSRDSINRVEFDSNLTWIKTALTLAPYWSMKFLDFITDKFMRSLDNIEAKNNLIKLIYDI